MRDVLLEMGGHENCDFERRSAIAAITKLLWNRFGVSATQVRVEPCRTVPDAPNEAIVIDNENTLALERARVSTKECGDAWRAQCVHTGTWIPRGNDEVRTNRLVLGDSFKGESAARVVGKKVGTHVRAEVLRPALGCIDHVCSPDGLVCPTTGPRKKEMMS